MVLDVLISWFVCLFVAWLVGWLRSVFSVFLVLWAADWTKPVLWRSRFEAETLENA